ncbi:MAG: KilA-N domain-containing protein [Bacteroidota bacterium]
MAKQQINIDGLEISLKRVNEEDYISLTDMAKSRDNQRAAIVIQNWFRNSATVRFLIAWERQNNPDFKVSQMTDFKDFANDDRNAITAKRYIEMTGAIGIQSRSGRYGGTFAHVDIAFEFGSWLSPEFKLYLITEFKRLKEEEAIRINSGWNYSRFLSKVNYRIHTDSIRDHLIPRLREQSQRFNEVAIYADEADLLNLAVFGMTAKEWREANPSQAKKGNIRDHADVMQLNVLANLESLNSVMIEAGASKEKRFQLLTKTAISQYERLAVQAGMKKLKE